jgi:hypothetical protein
VTIVSIGIFIRRNFTRFSVMFTTYSLPMRAQFIRVSIPSTITIRKEIHYALESVNARLHVQVRDLVKVKVNVSELPLVHLVPARLLSQVHVRWIRLMRHMNSLMRS